MFRRVFLAAAVSMAFASAASAATVTYVARLSGRTEVPKTDSKGTGRFNATFDTQTKELKYTLTFQNLTGPATAAHIHGPATRKQNAAVIVPLGDKNPTSPVSGTATLTEDQVKMLQSAKTYVNVHTAANPGGEIRGQVIAAHTRRRATSRSTAPAAAAPAETTAPAETAPTTAPK